MDRDSFDLAIQTSLLNTLRSLGEDCVTSILSHLGKGAEVGTNSLVSHLREVDTALDELFTKFSKIIKHVTILQACSQLKLKPPTLGNSLFWMVEELRASQWKGPS